MLVNDRSRFDTIDYIRDTIYYILSNHMAQGFPIPAASGLSAFIPPPQKNKKRDFDRWCRKRFFLQKNLFRHHLSKSLLNKWGAMARMGKPWASAGYTCILPYA